MMTLFPELDLTSARVPGLHPGQQNLLILIARLASDAGEWTGPRSRLAAELRCSVDTVTRRKDALVQAGLLEVASCGRSLTYRLIKSAIDSLPRGSNHGAPKRPPATSARRWWQRPDANQLDLFDRPTTRQEAREALKATTMHWMSLVICAVFGPDARRATPATFEAKPPAPPATSAALPATSAAEPAAEPTTSAAPIDDTCGKPTPPIGIGTTIPETQLLSPTQPISTTSRALKFRLWSNAKKSDFSEPMKVQEIFERLLKVGGCTTDERLQVFKFVSNAVELATPADNLPGLITSILRGAGTPWRSRGNAINERTAREMIRALDVPLDMQRRSSDLDLEQDIRKAEQIAALKQRGLI